MTEVEAAEVMMVSSVTIGCASCGGRGRDPERKRSEGVSAIYYCGVCNGAGVIINPIWRQAWHVLYPEDMRGMFERIRRATMSAYRERHSAT